MAGSPQDRDVPAELIERCQRGDRNAFQELFKRIIKDIHRILFRLSGPDPDMEDLVQQVLLALLGSIERFEGRSSFSTYLFGICFRVSKKRARSLGRLLRLRSAMACEPVQPLGLPDEQLARQQKAREAHKALGKLSHKLRSVLVMYEVEGLSGKEIAELCGIPEATVWSRLHLARKRLRRKSL